jgi:RNA-splicing ligase RtcB
LKNYGINSKEKINFPINEIRRRIIMSTSFTNIEGEYSNAKVYISDLSSMISSTAQIMMICDNIVSKDMNIVVMPDNHPGKVGPIGLTMMDVNNRLLSPIIPALVGNDIGCGVTVYKITKMKKGFEPEKLTSVIVDNIPTGSKKRDKDPYWAESEESELKVFKERRDFDIKRAIRASGTLGGGNHFIEIDKDDDKNYYIVVHTGSRYVGQYVFDRYMRLGQENLKSRGIEVPYEMTYLDEYSLYENGDNLIPLYMEDCENATEYASRNRYNIINTIASNMKWSIEKVCDCPHNFIRFEDNYRILRKGSISARKDEDVVIPINMKDGVILGKGKGNAEWNYSAPHGSGRIQKRVDVVNSHTVSEYKKVMKGIYSPTISADTLDEAPFAYRGIDEIINAIQDTVEVEKILKPVYNYKGGSR